MPVVTQAKPQNSVAVKRVDPEIYENAETASLDTDATHRFLGPGTGKSHFIANLGGGRSSLTGSLVGAYNPHVRTVYVYRVSNTQWRIHPPVLSLPMTVSSLSSESRRLIESFAALQRDLKRYSKYESNWDEAGAESFSSETISSAKEVVGQAYEATKRFHQKNVVPMI